MSSFGSNLVSVLAKDKKDPQTCAGLHCRLKRAALETLGTFDLDRFQLEQKNVSQDSVVTEKAAAECAVCFDTQRPGDLVAELKCKHIFHSPCLSMWLGEGHFSCPLCRAEVHKKVQKKSLFSFSFGVEIILQAWAFCHFSAFYCGIMAVAAFLLTFAVRGKFYHSDILTLFLGVTLSTFSRGAQEIPT